jgi:hypothetical protein
VSTNFSSLPRKPTDHGKASLTRRLNRSTISLSTATSLSTGYILPGRCLARVEHHSFIHRISQHKPVRMVNHGRHATRLLGSGAMTITDMDRSQDFSRGVHGHQLIQAAVAMEWNGFLSGDQQKVRRKDKLTWILAQHARVRTWRSFRHR